MSVMNPAGSQNVGETERMISMVGGALLAFAALRRAPWAMVLLALGGYLFLRGSRGMCYLYSALGLSSAVRQELAACQDPTDDQVDATVEDSFPASDPPGWHSGSSFTQVSE